MLKFMLAEHTGLEPFRILSTVFRSPRTILDCHSSSWHMGMKDSNSKLQRFVNGEKPESKDQFDLFHALRNDFRTIAAYNSMREVACENYS